MSLPVTEDTPPDMLAGSMDLKVVLPDGRSVKMSVQRGTPMMDLLVQVTTAHCLSPGDFSLQAMGDRGVLPFKPSTPIGALDTFAVKIVEKKLHARGRAPQVPQSFLNTFRLQVHLPRSQLFVLRVTPDITLSEIMTHICTEKNLNADKYEFRNPGNLDEVLELEKTLGDYKLQELSMMSKGNRTHVTGLMSSADVINLKSSKQRQNSVCDSSLSSGSFGSRSGSPIPPINVVTIPPQPPMRKKRRPAPKPPTFAENQKKDQTTGSVLISHSRESSDSSGYHEASVLSESPTHGSPAGRIESDSPPDTLPRRTKLPPSQSFTNLTSIPPAPKNRLTNSVSNTSLNSNGLSRKKRAPPPPPPPANHRQENTIKSSTLPTSVAEGRRTSSSFGHPPPDSPLEVAQAKVQSSADISSERIRETKASEDEVPGCVDVDVRVGPKPRPRTSLGGKTPTRKPPEERNVVWLELRGSGGLNRWRNMENLLEEGSGGVRGDKEAAEGPKRGEGGGESVAVADGAGNSKIGLLTESSVPPREEPSSETDHDSINWEYQLPPPPTDFRDNNSPSCTDFGTVTINPEVLENVGEREERKGGEGCERDGRVRGRGEWVSEKRFSQKKSVVMNELTNILSEKQRLKEKSLSVSNLYISDGSDGKEYRKNGLNYSRSFSSEPASCLENFQLRTYQGDVLGNNRKLSTSNEVIYKKESDEVRYRNNRNLEKSSSVECVQWERGERIRERGEGEEVFRKPVAPVQKKLKVAKRSASSVGTNQSNVQKRSSLEVSSGGDWEEDENIHILREQFLEFLKEKKLSKELNVKSLDVIRNILPELSQGENSHSRVNLVINQSNETNSQGRVSEERVKVVDVEVKAQEKKEEEEEKERKKEEEKEKKKKEEETKKKEEEEKKRKEEEKEREGVTKRYSYQGPPSINFGTWGERPKTTKIIIKDEDYVTREKVTEKKSEQGMRNGDVGVGVGVGVGVWQKPKEVGKRPSQITIKRPGVLSRYEMFSALPRRKEVSSLELVQMEDEERKRKAGGVGETSRVPVVCGMELKKELKGDVKERFGVEGEGKPKHCVSVYVNGAPEVERAGGLKLVLGKRNSLVMPVVKGFRVVEGKEREKEREKEEEKEKEVGSEMRVRIGGVKREGLQGDDGGRGRVNGGGVSLVKLKGGCGGVVRQKGVSGDPRGDLLEEIRNFGGLRKLKRTVAY